MLIVLGTAIAAVIACSSSSTPSHPAYTVDCQTPPISSGTPGDPCKGICLQVESCDGGSTTCPAGFSYGGVGQCPNSAVCCVFPDAGADGASDAPPDAPGADAPADSPVDGPAA